MQNATKKHLTLPGGQTIHYWEYHKTARRTIVMVHGFTGSHKGFMYLEPLLEDYRLIIPDLPGFGESDILLESEWSISGLASSLNQFVATLDFDAPPIVLGHSMGGLVVSAMVDERPELFSDVILISPVPTSIRKNDARLAGAVLGALQYRIGARTGKMGKGLVTSRSISRFATKLMTRTSDAARKRAIVEHHFENLDFISSIHFYEALYRDINRRGAIDHAATLKEKRILLIVGDDDNVTPLAEEVKLQAAINPERFIVIKNVGHLIHYERADEAAAAINEFLSQAT